MAKKYFCWNVDDGLEEDKRIVKLLREYGMGATFNLNAGMFGKKGMIGRIGNLGIKDVTLDQYKKSWHILKYCEHFRIPADEVQQVYQGFEIASHGYRHENLKKISEKEAAESIHNDVKALSARFHQNIRGFAYPYGAFTEAAILELQKAGICYARTIERATSFEKPADPMRTPMNGWHIDKDIMQKLDDFICTEAKENDLFFLMFAHGYEFTFNTKESNWDKFKRICDTVASRDDIICCSTAEALGGKI